MLKISIVKFRLRSTGQNN